MMAVVVPSLINIIVNVRILIHVRLSARRIHPQTITTLTPATNTQKPKISLREISLLRQMIFMFSMFIGGWTPVYITVIIMNLVSVDLFIFELAVVFGQLCLLCITMNLFICNHELRQFVLNKIRQFFRL